jgi:hypothetical protein
MKHLQLSLGVDAFVIVLSRRLCAYPAEHVPPV